MNKHKKLYRSQDCWVGGVCAGLAEYFDWDPVVVRLLSLVCLFSSFGFFVLVYFFLMIVVPQRRSY